MEVLVHEVCRGAIDASVDVERGVDESALERRAGPQVPAWNLLGPPIRLVGEKRERVIRSDLHLHPGDQLRDDGDLVDTRVPEARSRDAALDEERAALVVARHEPD